MIAIFSIDPSENLASFLFFFPLSDQILVFRFITFVDLSPLFMVLMGLYHLGIAVFRKKKNLIFSLDVYCFLHMINC